MQPLIHSLPCQTAKAMKRRTFLTIFAGASTCLLAPVFANARALAPGHVVMLRCLGNIPAMAARRTVRSAWRPTPVRATAEPVGGGRRRRRRHCAALPWQYSRLAMARWAHKGRICRLGAKSWPAVHRRPMARRGRRRRRYCVAAVSAIFQVRHGSTAEPPRARLDWRPS